jgi:transposase
MSALHLNGSTDVVLAAITEPRFAGADLRVLLLLAGRRHPAHWKDGGWCCLSHRQIAEELGVHLVTVRNSLKRLEVLGYVESRRRARKDGGDAPKLYRVRIPGSDEATPLGIVTAFVARDRRIDPALIRGRSRGSRDVVDARQLAEYLCVTHLDRPSSQVAPHFGRHRSTVDHALQAMEDRREDPAIDAWLDRLVARLTHLTRSRRRRSPRREALTRLERGLAAGAL